MPVRHGFASRSSVLGDVAGRDYLPEFHRIADRAEIVAVCGRGEDRARATGESLGVPWFTDRGTMFDAIEMDAVVNLTPIPVHEETTMAALEAGLHVYSEKPLGMSVDGAVRLRDEAAARGLVLVAAPSVLVFPQVRRARALLADGAIGAVHTVRGLGFGGVPPWEGYGSDPGPFFATRCWAARRPRGVPAACDHRSAGSGEEGLGDERSHQGSVRHHRGTARRPAGAGRHRRRLGR